jgi:hypothetical protein
MVDFLAQRFHNIGISPLILTRVNHSQCCLLAALHRKFHCFFST